jgi:septal ring-binding cell division protein DamX
VATSPAPAAPAVTAATATTNDDWLETRVNADVSRIGQIAATRFVIQLMTADARDRNSLEGFLRAVNRDLDADRIMLYPSGTKEFPKLSVLYGNYADRAEAAAELSGLPQRLTQSRPYVRSFQAVKDDLRR